MQEKFMAGKDPISTKLVEISLDEMKTLLARIEAKIKITTPGESVLTQFTESITLVTAVPKQKQ